MLTKETKIRVLENFHALDYIFFGKPVKKASPNCCPGLLEAYLQTKGTLLSVMIEIYKLVDHKPAAITEKIDSKNLRKSARSSAKTARENCQKLVASKKGRKAVKEQVSQILKENDISDVSTLIKNTIREKAFNLAVDNLLIARTLTETEHASKLDEWEGKLLEDAYKILRSDLTETALMILDSK